MTGAFIVAAFACFVLLLVWLGWRQSVRAEFIRSYTFPSGLYLKLRKKHPRLSLKDCQLAGQALRQFFLAYLKSGFRPVSMPSRLTDDLWHEFILYTKHYQAFCRKAFGRFLHHSPAVALGSERERNAGLRRCWWYACREENINPKSATRLPLLFAIDAKLDVAEGIRYRAGERPVPADSASVEVGVSYVTADFSSLSFDGTTDGLGDGGDGGDGGGCGGD